MAKKKKELRSVGLPTLTNASFLFSSVYNKWERQDSNLRRKTSTDLQSAAFDHSPLSLFSYLLPSPLPLVPIVLGKSAFFVERTYTMNGLFALGQSVPWLTNDHFEKNLFENSLMPHLTQQLLLPFLLHTSPLQLYATTS
uniref:ORF139B protein n=1 Tax=Turritis glabra TaxID=63678 RepID=A0A5H2UXU0_TURGL|nr:ORF139B protein [Turritis glabra]